jgi:ABC-type cobalamin/Fe3+-siderophores transport system ATPase subunit
MEITLTLKNYRCFSEEHPARLVLQPGFTSLLGLNNSGKSTLLRFFFEFRPIFQKLVSDSGAMDLMLRGFSTSWEAPPYVNELEELFFNGNQNEISIDLQASDPPAPSNPGIMVDRIRLTLDRKGLQRLAIITSSQELSLQSVVSNMLERKGNWYKGSSGTAADMEHIVSMLKILIDTFYIPAFRHITAFQPNQQGYSNQNKFYDAHVGQPFIELWNNSQVGPMRSRRMIIDLVKAVGKVFGYSELQIQAAPDNRMMHVIADGKPYKLHELGAGLAQFLMLLLNALQLHPSYILIDEPELNLHPALQLDVLTHLRATASQGVVFATHNLGLARQISDRMYTFSKSDAGSRMTPYDAHPNLAEFLGGLQFGAYDLAGVRKVLLVEGKNEILTMMELLRKFDKEHKVVLIPLGGSEWINKKSKQSLIQVLRITPHVHVLIDSERTAAQEMLAQDRRDFIKVCKRLGIPCKVLDRGAIENYFPASVVQSELGNQYKALNHFEKLEDITPRWSKSQNWILARALSKEDILNTDLGVFLSQL